MNDLSCFKEYEAVVRSENCFADDELVTVETGLVQPHDACIMPNKIDKNERPTWPVAQISSWRDSLGAGGVSIKGIDLLMKLLLSSDAKEKLYHS